MKNNPDYKEPRIKLCWINTAQHIWIYVMSFVTGMYFIIYQINDVIIMKEMSFLGAFLIIATSAV